MGWAAVGDLARGSGFLAAGGADATGCDLALAEGRVGMARAGEIGLTIGIIAVWLADRLHAPELHTGRQARRIRQAAAGGIGAQLAWAELSAISGLSPLFLEIQHLGRLLGLLVSWSLVDEGRLASTCSPHQKNALTSSGGSSTSLTMIHDTGQPICVNLMQGEELISRVNLVLRVLTPQVGRERLQILLTGGECDNSGTYECTKEIFYWIVW